MAEDWRDLEAPHDRWQVVAAMIRARRETLGFTRDQVVARADGAVSASVVRALEIASQTRYRRTKIAAVCRALDWTPDSIRRILDGEEPVETAALATAAEREEGLRSEIAELRVRIEELSALVRGRFEAQ